ncbi:hypothetical protein TNCV_2720421 [Trichonephila clavipes]|nr:hypothetical protein TNCV_2720421 [Trichonephila clavipes]
MHLKVSRHLKERYQYGDMSTVECDAAFHTSYTYFAQHYPAVVAGNLSHSSVRCTDEGVLVCRRDSFDQQLASPKASTHFQVGFRSWRTR